MVNTCIDIQDQTNVAEVRRAALLLASELAFDDTAAGNVGLVVTEAAKNVLKHAGSGQILVRALGQNGGSGIEILALDKGPGISDVGRCFEDGYSTAGTTGTGLGAIARNSSAHEVYSRRGQGTVLMAQVWNRNAPPPHASRFSVGGVCVPLRGELESGDSWVVQERPRGVRLTVADGLGHGPLAAVASQAAIRVAKDQPGEAVAALMGRMHNEMRATRGAAVSLADIDVTSGVVRFVGVGNVSAIVAPHGGAVRRMVSVAGTAGLEVRKVVEFTYPWTADCLLVMHSDGLQTHWSLDAYPGLSERHPSLIAAVLYRDFSRGRDDVAVVVAREVKANQ